MWHGGIVRRRNKRVVQQVGTGGGRRARKVAWYGAKGGGRCHRRRKRRCECRMHQRCIGHIMEWHRRRQRQGRLVHVDRYGGRLARCRTRFESQVLLRHRYASIRRATRGRIYVRHTEAWLYRQIELGRGNRGTRAGRHGRGVSHGWIRLDPRCHGSWQWSCGRRGLRWYVECLAKIIRGRRMRRLSRVESLRRRWRLRNR